MWTVILESFKIYRKWWFGIIAFVIIGYLIYFAIAIPVNKQSSVFGIIPILTIYTLILPFPIIWIISWIKQKTTDGYPISEKTFMILFSIVISIRMMIYMIAFQVL